MVQRIQKFEMEMETDTVNLKVLQALLQGSVLACTTKYQFIFF